MANAMMVIHPYRAHDMWVFDDPAVGLVQEPFVFGVPEMIDQATKSIPGAANGFRLLFSAKPFPASNMNSLGCAKSMKATDIVGSQAARKAGFVRRCSSISRPRLNRFIAAWSRAERPPDDRRVGARLLET